MSDAVIPFHTLGAEERVHTKYTDRLDRLRRSFASGKTKSVKWRIQQLKAMRRFLEDHRGAFKQAMKKDLNKNPMEADLFEVEFVINEIRGALQEIHEWVKPEPISRNALSMLDTLYMWNEPYGVCLVMGAWNYPVMLTLSPGVGALAAGNAVVFKPSDLSPETAALFEKMSAYMDPDATLVIPGGIPESSELLKEKFDHIFYTGSINGGKIVHAAAQRYLTPIVLELGGKCPVYIDSDVDLEVATKRLLWGKFVNAGQTCVGPDHVFVPEKIYEEFIDVSKRVVKQFYGDDPKKSPDFGRIVSSRHAKRLQNLLQGSQAVFGGDVDVETCYVSPTLLRDVAISDPIMAEEIFGPILPVIKVRDLSEAIEMINARDKPLTAYVFSRDRTVIDGFIERTSSGSVCANDVLVMLTIDSVPFGGVGPSGMGRYHGKHSFDCFSNKKPVLERDFNPVGEYLGKFRYPPQSSLGIEIFRQLMWKRPNPFNFVMSSAPYLIGSVAGIGATLVYQMTMS
ncbi:aldehyde dehydrogenase, dimeric NADP-preferring-like [Galendromus occidentalis]|uniref:Aldehyde dehydrogenase n=1 Tax=Galendromus occidentalis TaxID=34638 RepID=A0AAJ7WIF8_9ACAR|nr:aldehyde dehydrogenase, dimeric NADP-preferring-like [Galendromus occidentalis]